MTGSAPAARSVADAAAEFCGVFADDAVIESAGPALSCLEADALAALLEVAGYPAAAAAYRAGHCCLEALEADG